MWWNECVTNWVNKFPALYLYGPSNSGKTTIITDWLLKDLKSDQIYRPTRNDEFAWQSFNSNKHLVVVIDECDLKKFDIDEWKQCMQGSVVSVKIKGGERRDIAVKCPIIHISNYEPLQTGDVLNRIHIVKTSKIYPPVMIRNFEIFNMN